MFSKKSKQPPIKSLIAHGSAIEGHVSFTDGLRIDGAVTGNVCAREETPSMLVISEEAKVVGEVRAHHIIINGRIEGPVHATDLLELQPKAVIVGDVYYKALEMHQGAAIAGQMFPMGFTEEEKPTLILAANNS
jgi:cytoskeletal protein CcmA (bactofilin family)